jgi:membrane protein implicated in regulation of membrane protease activity
MTITGSLAWIVIAVVAAIVEISVPHFGLIFVAIAALGAALAAFLDFGLSTELIVFMLLLGLSLAVLRPRLIQGAGAKGVPERTTLLIGRDGVVTHDIESSVGAGRVNVGGEDWAARAAVPLPAGTRVRIVKADGIVLEVTPT